MCERIAMMYLEIIVEIGETEKVIQEPLHPYTQALINAVSIPDPTYRRGKIPKRGAKTSKC
ncbi:MAG: hypothetical protein NDF56_07145 [archaeon GB-1845-036]|nr:hypothetical protein [Candidatus Culexmicrobium thermophilum]